MEESFPYDETRDQLEAIADIKADMEAPSPWTACCAATWVLARPRSPCAAFKCVDSGRRSWCSAPRPFLPSSTTRRSFERFAPFGLLRSRCSAVSARRRSKSALKAFAEGTIDVLIGTHRLLSADVNPKNPGLVIIDEEQRFGVQHKEQLKNLREQIDVLHARQRRFRGTMQMATSGVRDMSLITTPPTGVVP